jgi:polyphosphate kinase
VVDLLRTASIDPKVRSIRITLYRLARNSKVVNALINAARNGKMVTVFVELQARFDEEANIQYTGQMQEAGVKIITGIPGFKVHGKLLLIRRKDEGKSRYYSYIATGNFNEQTARVYADSCLLTTDADIARDVRKIFDILKTQFQSARFKRLILSPFSQRNFFIKMINNESANARAGKRAEIIIKLNNLVDEKIVRKLYLAGKSGVKIRLIIRGICILVPENPEVSEKIECISILDRFLEHTRILYFYNGGDERIFISSADWMKRNFDTRIEVTCPVRDPDLKAELKKMLEFQLADNTKARIISSDGRNEYVKSADGGKIRSQQEFYEYLKGRQ